MSDENRALNLEETYDEKFPKVKLSWDEWVRRIHHIAVEVLFYSEQDIYLPCGCPFHWEVIGDEAEFYQRSGVGGLSLGVHIRLGEFENPDTRIISEKGIRELLKNHRLAYAKSLIERGADIFLLSFSEWKKGYLNHDYNPLSFKNSGGVCAAKCCHSSTYFLMLGVADGRCPYEGATRISGDELLARIEHDNFLHTTRDDAEHAKQTAQQYMARLRLLAELEHRELRLRSWNGAGTWEVVPEAMASGGGILYTSVYKPPERSKEELLREVRKQIARTRKEI